MCYPQQLGRSSNVLVTEPSGTLFAMCTGTFQKIIRYLPCYLPRNPPEPHQLSGPEPSGTSSALCTGTIPNLITHLQRNRPKPCLLSAPEPSEPCLPSVLEPSVISSAICAGTRGTLSASAPEPFRTIQNVISYLRWNRPEPCLQSAPTIVGEKCLIFFPNGVSVKRF